MPLSLERMAKRASFAMLTKAAHPCAGRGLKNMIKLPDFQSWMAGESLWIREADKIRAFCAAVTSKRQEVFCV